MMFEKLFCDFLTLVTVTLAQLISIMYGLLFIHPTPSPPSVRTSHVKAPFAAALDHLSGGKEYIEKSADGGREKEKAKNLQHCAINL